MKSVVVGFSGAIGSGKSTLAEAVAETLGCSLASFGDVVRAEAARLGFDPSVREVLQAVGSDLINDGWANFCRMLLEQANWKPGAPLVVDGIRHLEALETLRVLASPQKVTLVYLAIDEAERSARLSTKGLLDPARLSHVDSHSTEIQVLDRLPAVANLIVDGSRPVPELVEQVNTWLDKANESSSGRC